MLRTRLSFSMIVMGMWLFAGCDAASHRADSVPKNSQWAELPHDQATRNSAARPDEGIGPGQRGDQFDRIVENGFLAVRDNPLSTFSIDVDTAAYSKVRSYLLQSHTLPPPDAVRIEELVNYFSYDYAPPRDAHPFAVHLAAAMCPWQPAHQLVRIGIKGRENDDSRPACNLVFLIDVSGSMDSPNRLPLVQRSLQMLTRQLRGEDRVAIVVYAGAAGLVLPSTSGDQQSTILAALTQLKAGGSTNGGQGIQRAYDVAREHFVADGVNRVMLCTDGDFNVGITSTGDLVRLAEHEAQTGVYLTVLGFGMGNHNDALLEQLANKANGNYAYIDSDAEARKVLVDQLGGTLIAIAKDVKIQVEFNPAHVAAYRLIGYEDRLLADRDFNDDRKDAGEIGEGHTVTALYEIVPAGAQKDVTVARVDALKYQRPREDSPAVARDELLTVKLRYKQPSAEISQLLSVPLTARQATANETSPDLRFASAVALFGMLLRKSEHCGTANFDTVLEIAAAARGSDRQGYRAEFIELVREARRLSDVPRTVSRDVGSYTFPAARPNGPRNVVAARSDPANNKAVVWAQHMASRFSLADAAFLMVACVAFGVAVVGCVMALICLARLEPGGADAPETLPKHWTLLKSTRG